MTPLLLKYKHMTAVSYCNRNPMKNDHFRHWLNEKWFEHRDEILVYGSPQEFATADSYFAKYKWWLKTVYQKQQQEAKKAQHG